MTTLTNKTSITLSFPASGYIDGRFLSALQPASLTFTAARLPTPLPNSKVLDKHTVNNVSFPTFYIPAAEQNFMVPLGLIVPSFNRTLEYDPGISRCISPWTKKNQKKKTKKKNKKKNTGAKKKTVRSFQFLELTIPALSNQIFPSLSCLIRHRPYHPPSRTP